MGLRSEYIRQSDAWISALVLLFLPQLVIHVFAPRIQTSFPFIAFDVIISFAVLLTEIVVIGYLIHRLGRVTLEELLPRGKEYVALIGGIITLFWIFGLTVGSEGLHSRRYDQMRNLPAWQYWWAVLDMVVLSPVLEETYLRRFFLEILRRHFPLSLAILLTTLVATVFHIGAPIEVLLWSTLDQLLFAIVYLNSRLGGAVAVHVFDNAMVLLLAR